MKRYLPVVLIVFVCLMGCTKNKERATAESSPGLKEAMAKKSRNLTEKPLLKKGDLHVDPETLKPYSGGVFELHEKKKVVRREYRLLNGKEHGLYTSYREDGAKSNEANYKDGKEHGRFTSFYKDGTKQNETHYKHGKLHGPHRAWDLDGKLIHEETF